MGKYWLKNGSVRGEKEYIDLVEVNKGKFPGHRFELHDGIYGSDKGCVRYSAIQCNLEGIIHQMPY